MQYKSCSIQSLFDCLLLQWRRQNSYTIKSLLYWYNWHVSLLFQNHHKLLWNTYFRAGWMIETVEWIIPYFGVCMKRKYPKTLQFCLLYSKVYFPLFLTFSICSLIFFCWGDFVPQKLSIGLYPEHFPSYEHYLYKIVLVWTVPLFSTWLHLQGCALCKLGLLKPTTM